MVVPLLRKTLCGTRSMEIVTGIAGVLLKKKRNPCSVLHHSCFMLEGTCILNERFAITYDIAKIWRDKLMPEKRMECSRNRMNKIT